MQYESLKIESNQWNHLITKEGMDLGVNLKAEQVHKMKIHAIELLKWNKIFNLTTITKPVDIAVKHFLDSLAVVPFINKKARILDIGSGAGFPGIPLKILLPYSTITLMESSRKKFSFLKYILQTLRLDNILALHANCEYLTDFTLYKNSFDVVICRALTNLKHFIKIALPFLSKGGTIIALKGKVEKNKSGDNYIDGIKLNTKFIFTNKSFSVDSYFYSLPILCSSRNIVFIKRI